MRVVCAALTTLLALAFWNLMSGNRDRDDQRPECLDLPRDYTLNVSEYLVKWIPPANLLTPQ